jgi:ribose transport system substrate-binding protein
MNDFGNRNSKVIAARVALTGLVVLAAALAFATVGRSSSAKQDKTVRLSFFAPLRGNSYIDAEIKGAQDAAKKYGGSVTVLDGKADPNVQYRQIQDATAAKSMDAAIFFPLNGALPVPVIKDALKSGVKGVCLFTPCGPKETSNKVQIPGLTLQIGSSPIREGQYMGKATIGACKGHNPCSVTFLSSFGIQATDAVRKKAWQATIKSHPEIKLVASGDGKSSADVARTLVLDQLQAHPEINVVVTAGDQMAHGAEFAVADSGKKGKVLIIGEGASEIGVKAVKAGLWYSTGILVPYTEGYVAAQYAIQAAQGKKKGSTSIISQDLVKRDVMITKKTAGTFKPQWKG